MSNIRKYNQYKSKSMVLIEKTDDDKISLTFNQIDEFGDQKDDIVLETDLSSIERDINRAERRVTDYQSRINLLNDEIGTLENLKKDIEKI